MRRHKIIPLEERIVLDAAIGAALVAGAPPDASSAAPHADDGGQASDAQHSSATDSGDHSSVTSPTGDASSNDSTSTTSQNSAEPVRVLLISSSIKDYQKLADAADKSVLVVTYDQTSTLESLLQSIRTTLDGKTADSIGIATPGQADLVKLTETLWITPDALKSDSMTTFLSNLGQMVKDGGTVDFLTCNLTQFDTHMLTQIDHLLDTSNHDIHAAASSDFTSNQFNWYLESGNRDGAMYFDHSQLSQWDGHLATFTVTNNADSGAGSLRTAITNANTTAGADTINFSANFTITPTTVLPTITEAVTIDATGRTISLVGNNTLAGLIIGNGVNNVTVMNIDFSNFDYAIEVGTTSAGTNTNITITDSSFVGNGILMVSGTGNSFDIESNLFQGNGTLGQGIQSTGRIMDSWIISNNIFGFDAAQTTTNLTLAVQAIFFNTSTLTNFTINNNVFGSANTTGALINLGSISNSTISGNTIGTNAAHTVSTVGTPNNLIVIQSGTSNTTFSGNYITSVGSVVNQNALNITGATNLDITNNTFTSVDGINILGVNYSGSDIQGNTFTGGTQGMNLTTSSNNLISQNTITGTTNASGAAINIVSGTGNEITQNSIYSNAGQGINLGTIGITANDANDVDTGANNLQNFPIVTSVQNNGTNTFIAGTLNSTPSSNFRVELFANVNSDAPGNGEGQTYLGFVNVTTDASGNASFSTTVTTASLAGGTFVTATATSLTTNDTSEFSASVASQNLTLSVGDVTVTEGDTGTSNMVFTVNLSAAFGAPVTVQYQTANNTATAGTDYTALALTTLTFAAGETSKQVTVTVSNDYVTEGNETLFLNLSNASGATIADSQGIGTITNNDATVVTAAGDAATSVNLTDISIRKAILVANATTGTDTITFSLPGLTNVTLTSVLPTLTESVTIDGTTMTGYSNAPLFFMNGNAGAVANGIIIGNGVDSVTIRALGFYNFSTSGSGILGAGNTPATSNDNITIDKNYFGLTTSLANGSTTNSSGIIYGNSSNWIVTNNVFGGLNSAIKANLTSSMTTLEIGNNIIGLTPDQTALRNVTTTLSAGSQVSGLNMHDNVIIGQIYNGGSLLSSTITNNTFGTNAAHTINSGSTIITIGSLANTVISNNYFNGNSGFNVLDFANASGSNFQVLNNTFTAGINNGYIDLGGTTGTVISGNTFQNAVNSGPGFSSIKIASGSGTISNNTIINNPSTSPAISLTGTANYFITQNSIYNNGGLGIDLGNNGVTANDAGDADTGPNALQNYPVSLSAFTFNGTSVSVSGSLNSAANTTYRIEFFTSPSPDPSGFGEGQTYVGFVNVTTNGSGTANINTSFSLAQLPVGSYLTATASTTTGTQVTSEFSAPTIVKPGVTMNATSSVTEGDTGTTLMNFTLTLNASSSQTVNVQVSTVSGTATAGVDYTALTNQTVTFNPGETSKNYSVTILNDYVIEANETITLAGNSTDAVFVVNGSTGTITNNDATVVTTGGESATSTGLTDISIRKAILVANATAGTDTISFSLPSATTVALTSLLPTLTEAVTIDGTTMTGYTSAPLFTLTGNASSTNGLVIGTDVDNVTIRALSFGQFSANAILAQGGTSDNIVIDKSYFGPAGSNGFGIGFTSGSNWTITDNVINGSGSAIRNAVANPTISGWNIGNNIIGFNPTQTASANNGNGLFYTANASNMNIHDNVFGAGFNTFTATNSTITNNTFGTNAAHTINVGSSARLTLSGDYTNTVISGNYFQTAYLDATPSSATNNLQILNNTFFNAAASSPAINYLTDATNGLISGNLIENSTTAFGAIRITSTGGGVISNNIIRNNTGSISNTAAIAIIGSTTTGFSITQNSIYNNVGLGIDLGAPDGVTANDAGDADSGPNGLQNYPIITSAVVTGSGTLVTGTLNSTANTTFRIEFFGNDVSDPSGFGEGKTYAGFVNVTTDGSGNASFSTTIPLGTILTGHFVTATATNTTTNNTSEFSGVTTAIARAVSVNDVSAYEGDAGTTTLTFTVSLNAASSNTITVDYQTQDGSAVSGTDYTALGLTTLTFNPGETTKTVDVTLSTDYLRESNKAFNLVLSNVTGDASIGDNTGVGTILNNDETVVTAAGDSATSANLTDISIRKAILVSNATAGTDTISFNLSGLTNVTLTSQLASLTDSVTIDGTTMTGYTNAPLFYINGNNKAVQNGLIISAGVDNVTIKALGLYGFNSRVILAQGAAATSNDNITIDSNYFGLTPSLTAGNNGAGIGHGQASGWNITNNVFAGLTPWALITDIASTTVSGWTIANNILGFNPSQTAVIANTSGFIINTSSSNMNIHDNIFGGSSTALSISAANSIITNNTFGTNAAHTLVAGSSLSITNFGSNSNTVVSNNYIANSTANGMQITVNNLTNNLQIINNTITNLNAPSFAGIGYFNSVTNPTNTVISGNIIENSSVSTGISVSASNVTISNNIIRNLTGSGRGIQVTNTSATSVNITQNSIYNNAGLGIDLGPTGVTANDLGDADTGANGLQNYPVTTSAVVMGGQTYIFGTLNSTANTTFRIEYFANTAPDSSGFGEGQTYLGFLDVTTDASGNANVNTTFTTSQLPAGSYLTTTARNLTTSETSEFSQATLVNNYVNPNITINDVSMNEGNEGTLPNMTFTVTLDAASLFPVTVQYQTANGTATTGAGNDYFGVPLSTLTFNPGETTKTINVTIDGDAFSEPNENFFVNLSNATNATILDSQGEGTILNDDLSVDWGTGNVSVTEGNSGTTVVQFTLNAAHASSVARSVTVVFINGSATTADNDYVGTSQVVTFNPGETTKTFDVTINGDNYQEGNETFSMQLSPGISVTTTGITRTVTITNDDTAGIVVTPTSGLTTTEAGGTAQFSVVLTSAPRSPVTIALASNDATEGLTDVTSLTFNDTNWNVAQTVTVTGQDDATVDGNIPYQVILNAATSSDANYNSLDPANVSLTNTDNDIATLSINDVSTFEGDTGTTTISFTVTLSTASESTVTVQYQTQDGTALAGIDYTATGLQTLTFNPGELTKTINVTLPADYVREANKAFNVVLSNASGASISDDTGVGTILNNDETIVTAGTDAATSANLTDISLRKAVLVANATSGVDTISFNLSGLTNVTLASGLTISESVTIDGTTMTGYTNAPLLYIHGSTATFSGLTIDPGVSNVTIRALGLYNFSSQIFTSGTSLNPNDNITIENNYFGLNTSLTASGGGIGITARAGSGWIISDNVFAGVSTLSTSDLNSAQTNWTVDNNIVGFNPSQTALIAGTTGFSFGIANGMNFHDNILAGTGSTAGFRTSGGTSMTITNNTFGTNASHTITQTSGLSNTAIAFGNASSSNTVISNNYITGTMLNSILINSSSLTDNLQILNNTIANITGAQQGIILTYTTTQPTNTLVSGNTIENSSFASAALYSVTGSVTVSNNIIRNNTGTGQAIAVDPNATGVNITQNSIYNNSSLGIDLGKNGVTLNDLGDADTGANNLQNFPVTTSAQVFGGQTYIFGTLNSTANTSFRIEYFANTAPDSTGYGEGQTYLGFITVTTDGSGNANVNTSFSTSLLPAGKYLTTTATNLTTNSTSEFSQATLVANYVAPNINISDAVVTEGNSGSVNATFTVTLDAASSFPVTVQYQTANGTATTTDNDYSALALSTLTFNAGETSKTITVQVNGDNYQEGNENFFVNLSNATNATIADGQGQGTITNDDTAGITVTPTSGLSTTEAGGSAQFTVVLTSAPRSPVTITLASSDAAEGLTNVGSLTFDDTNWNVAQTVNVTGQDDALVDGNIAYQVILNAATSSDADYNGINPSDVSLTNLDNDTANITINDATVTEGNGGTVNAVFTVSLSSVSSTPVTVQYQTTDGSATTTDNDYIGHALTTLTFNPGETTKTISVAVNGDNYQEGNENFFINLSNATGATITDSQGEGTITNDDTAGIVVTPTSGLTTTEAGGTAQFNVVLTSAPRSPVTITLASSDATEGLTNVGSLTFDDTNWNIAQTVTVTGQDDAIVDGNIAYQVVLNAATSSDVNYNGINPADVSLTNTDNDATTLSINDVSAYEGDTGTTSISFTVTLSAASASTVTVQYQTQDDTALAGTDYTATGLQTLTFNPGEMTKTINVTLPTDYVRETNKAFNVVLSNATGGATISDNTAVGTILNNDETIVTSNSDNGTSADLTDISLRKAILVANATAGTDTISFTIPGSGQQTISLASNLPTLTSNVILDATTQAGYNATTRIPMIVVSGAGTGFGFGFAVNASNITIKGFAFENVTDGISSSSTPHDNITIQYNWFGQSGTSSLSRGIIIADLGTSNNWLIDSNVFISNDAGNFALSQTNTSTILNNFTISNNVFGTDWSQTINDANYYNTSHVRFLAAQTNNFMITNNSFQGIKSGGSALVLNNPTGSIISGNLFGTIPNLVSLTNLGEITLTGGSNTTISNNTLSYSSGSATNVGISITGGGSGYQILNNSITAGGGTGINLDTTSGALIKGNTITGVAGVGIKVTSGTGNTITQNSVFTNGGLGIDLGNDGVTANDLGDTDTGANDLQNNPVTTSAQVLGGQTYIFGTLNSTANTTYRIEYFANTAADPSGYGEGQTYLGFVDVTTDGSGNASVNTTFATGLLPAGSYLTTTATNLTTGSTSEFGQATLVANYTPPSINISDATVTEGNSGSVNATFTVTLDAASSFPVTVQYQTANGTATTADNDYLALALSTLTFNAGETSKTITVQVNGDNYQEGNETFLVNLSNATNATIADGQGEGTITNDDTAGISVTPASGLTTTEAGGTAQFNVVLTSAPRSPVTITLGSNDATEGTTNVTSLTFDDTNWNVAQTVTVTGQDDAIVDGNIAYQVVLNAATSSDADYNGINPADVSLTNLDNDTANITINDATVTEGNGGTVNAVFTVTLSTASTSPITVQYQTADGSASTADNDYISHALQTLTFSPGEMTKTITVAINGDNYQEGNENFFINLSNATGATITDGQGEGTITNDDTAGIVVTPTSGLTTTEAGGTAQFTVVLTSAPRSPVTITLASNDATEGLTSVGSLTFDDTNWNVAQIVTVTGQDDATVDGNIAYQVILNAATSSDADYNGINPADISLTNLDNDAATLSINDASAFEGDTGTTTVSFTVTLSTASASPVTVQYQTQDGTAIAGTDYTASGLQTLTFNPGETTKTVNVSLPFDYIREANKAFNVVLSGASGATISDDTGVGTILNNDETIVTAGTDAATSANLTDISLRKAMLVANATSGTDTISFNLPTQTTVTLTALLPTITESVTIDGTTMPGYTTAPLFYINGNSARTNSFIIATDIDNVTIRGLAMYNFTSHAISALSTSATSNDFITIEKNYFGLTPSLTFGSAHYSIGFGQGSQWTVTDNVMATGGMITAVSGTTLSNTIIAYNTLGLNPSQTANNLANGFFITTSNSLNIHDNIIVGGNAISLTTTANSTITNNTIGTNAAHTIFGNNSVSIGVGSTNTIISNNYISGGSLTGLQLLLNSASSNLQVINNTFSGIFNSGGAQDAILVSYSGGGSPTNILISGNLIENSTFSLGGVASGIVVTGGSNITVSNNTIRNNTGKGITVTNATGVNITQNSIYNNTGLGIDLFPNGVTPNDLGDADTGGNGLQNYPVTTSAQALGGQTYIFGTLNSTANTSFRVEYFANTAADPSGFGEGQTYLGFITVTTDASGNASVNNTFATSLLPAGSYLTTTATNLTTNATSEFSQATLVANYAAPNINISDATVTEGNSGAVNATFTVTLDASSSFPVTVQYQTANGTATTADNDYLALALSTLTFNAGETSKTITVQVNGDNYQEGNETFLVNLSNATNATIADGQGQGTITNDDTAGIAVTPTSGLTTTEAGGTAQFSVVLTSAPRSPVTITLGSNDATEGTTNVSSLTFDETNWNVAQTVTVTGQDDAIVDGNIAYQVVLNAATSSDANYNGINPADVSLTNLDNDTANITISDASVTEGNGGTVNAVFTVTLSNASTSPITVQYQTADGTATAADNDYISQALQTLTFNPGETTKTITVAINGDNYQEGNENFFINLSNASGATITDSQGEGAITNDDTAGIAVSPTSGLTTTEAGGTAQFTVVLTSAPRSPVTITLGSNDASEGTTNVNSLTFDSTNWNIAQTVTVTGQDDALVDGNVPYQVILNAATSSDADYNGINPADVSLTNLDNDTANISINDVTVLEGNGGTVNAVFTVTLNNASTSPITVQYQTADGSATTADSDYISQTLQTLTFNPGEMTKTITVAINGDNYQEGNENFFINLSNASGATITDSQGEGTITNDDTAGIVVTPTSGLTTTEAGGTAQFSVVLTSAPRSPVTITLGSNDATEGTTNVNSLTFDSTNWNIAQTVTVTGQDDAIVDGNIAYQVILNAATSSDADYNGINPSDVSLTNIDNDAATLSINDVTVTEGNSGTINAVFTVTLSTASATPVTVQYQTADGSATTADNDYISQALQTLTFNPGETTKTITVAINGDNYQEGNENFFINLSNASGATITDSQGEGTITNDDTAGIVVTPTSGLTTTEAGGTAQFSVVLTSAPRSPVTITLATSDATEGTPNVSSLTFNDTNWNVAQNVIVTGADDIIVDGNIPYQVILNSATSSDANYNGVNPADVSLTNMDNDTATISINDVTITEGNSGTFNATFTVTLSNASTSPVTVQYQTADGTATIADNDYTGLPLSTLTFNPGETSKTITVQVKGDNYAEANENFFVNLSNASGATIADNQGQGTITNDDTVGVIVTPTSGLVTTESGGTAQFTVRLTSAPRATVTITLTSSDTTEGTINVATLTFNDTNWNTPQTVTVTGQDDAIVDGNISYQVVLNPATSADAAYNGLNPADVSLTNIDNDTSTGGTKLWGIDEDDGQLFSFDDPTNPLGTFTSYGNLMYYDPISGTNKYIGDSIESFAIDGNNMAYFVVNDYLSGYGYHMLLKINLNTVSTAGNNVATVVGSTSSDCSCYNPSDDIYGLAFDPITGQLYALMKTNIADSLALINTSTGGATLIGKMIGADAKITVGEDLKFDNAGNLYATDNSKDRLYKINLADGRISSTIDNNEQGGLGVCELKLSALAWYNEGNKFIGTDDNNDLYTYITLDNGNNINVATLTSLGLTDVTGLDFSNKTIGNTQALHLDNNEQLYIEKSAAIFVIETSNIILNGHSLANGKITFKFEGGTGSIYDLLSIGAINGITTSSNNIYFNAILIGTYTGGTSGTNLVVNLNANATEAGAEALITALTFKINSNTPSTVERQIGITVENSIGGISNKAIKLVEIQAVNDAPAINDINDIYGIQKNQSTAVKDSLGNTLSVTDVDAAVDEIMKLELGVKYGTLTIDYVSLGLSSFAQLETIFGIDFFRGDGNSDKNMGFYGTQTQINQVLGALKYLNTTTKNDVLTISIFNTGTNGNTNGEPYDTETVNLYMN